MRRALAFLLLLTVGGLALVVLSAAGDYPPGIRAERAADAPPPAGPPDWAAPAAAGRTVVVLLFDGLSPEMVAAQETPAFDRIRREGAFSHGLRHAFPTVSLVNGFTLTTGCWPARHGIVQNRFLDPARGLYDHSRDADWIVECEPLHEAAERQGARAASLGWYAARSGSRGWLVSEAADARPLGDEERIDWALERLARPPGERLRLILVYLEGPDSAAHYEGLDSPALRTAVADADAAVGRTMRAIERSGQLGDTALVVLTDHGMRPADRLVNLERILRRRRLGATLLATGSVGFVYLEDPAEIGRAERELAAYPWFDVFRRDRQPPWARLGTGPRVPDLIVSAHPPHFIEDRSTWPRWVRWLALHGPERGDASRFLRATHGYPPEAAGMAGVLYAWGDGVARGAEVASLEMVDVHPTLARLLGIRPGRPLDGRVAPELLAAPPAGE